MKITVDIGKCYALRSEMGGVVTNAKTEKPLETLAPNAQIHMTAQEPEWNVPDDCAVTKVVFNFALAALGLLGGGADKLPAGYTRAEFLRSTGTQYIDTEVYNFESFIIDYKSTGGSYWSNILGHIPSGYTRRFAATSGQYVAVFNPNQGYIRGTLDHSPYVRNVVEHSIAMGAKLVLNGEIIPFLDYIAENPVHNTIEGDLSAYLFASNLGTSLSYGYAAIYGCKMIDNAGVIVRDFIPALDPTGAPCMFDRVSKQPFRNSGSGSFIAGVGTVAQLTALLRNLPDTGGELTLSLPAEANTPEVAEALQACHDTKGWTLTVQEYRPAAVATYSLRRVREVVWCRVAACEHGSYANVHGVRYNIEHCAAIFGPHGQDPTDYGYEPFDSVEEAAEEWGLVPYVDPNAEPETEPETELETELEL